MRSHAYLTRISLAWNWKCLGLLVALRCCFDQLRLLGLTLLGRDRLILHFWHRRNVDALRHDHLLFTERDDSIARFHALRDRAIPVIGFFERRDRAIRFLCDSHQIVVVSICTGDTHAQDDTCETDEG